MSEQLRRWKRGQPRPERYDLKWFPSPARAPEPFPQPTAWLEAYGARGYSSPNLKPLGPDGRGVIRYSIISFATEVSKIISAGESWDVSIDMPGRPTLESDWPSEAAAKAHCQAHYDEVILEMRHNAFDPPSYKGRPASPVQPKQNPMPWGRFVWMAIAVGIVIVLVRTCGG